MIVCDRCFRPITPNDDEWASVLYSGVRFRGAVKHEQCPPDLSVDQLRADLDRACREQFGEERAFVLIRDLSRRLLPEGWTVEHRIIGEFRVQQGRMIATHASRNDLVVTMGSPAIVDRGKHDLEVVGYRLVQHGVIE